MLGIGSHVKYITEDQISDNVNKNIKNKGFADSQPTTGCTYVVQPPKDYQDIFQSLQKAIDKENLPTAYVRIPHATVIAAKVVDQGPNQSWKDLEEVQRVYRNFFLHHVNAEMEKNGGNYDEALENTLKKEEATLAKISLANNKMEALDVIPFDQLREAVSRLQLTNEKYSKIKEIALKEINKSSFELKVTEVKLTNNGSVLFQLSGDEKLLKLRLNLIIAGEGISKWPKLSVMKNAWSTVAYTTKILNKEEKEKLDQVIQKWTDKHLSKLDKVTVPFDASHLGALAFRSNDFCYAKKAIFPLSPKAINADEIQLEEKDLSITDHLDGQCITPVMQRRQRPTFAKEDWNRVINEEVR